jgi:hypothetical protein
MSSSSSSSSSRAMARLLLLGLGLALLHGPAPSLAFSFAPLSLPRMVVGPQQQQHGWHRRAVLLAPAPWSGPLSPSGACRRPGLLFCAQTQTLVDESELEGVLNPFLLLACLLRSTVLQIWRADINSRYYSYSGTLAINDACDRVILILRKGDETKAAELAAELTADVEYLMREQEHTPAIFLQYLVDILRHRYPEDADEFTGPYARASRRIQSALDGTTWAMLGSPHQAHGAGSHSSSQQHQEGTNSSPPAEPPASSENYYSLLGVARSSSSQEIKSAFRKLAMEVCPSVVLLAFA